MIDRLLKIWGYLAVPLLVVCLAVVPLRESRALTNLFLVSQDLPILIGVLIVEIAYRRAPGLAKTSVTAASRLASMPVLRGVMQPTRPWLVVALLAAACLLIGWIGTGLVYDGYALSMDEFMANFDATILAHGQLMAKIAPAWRGDISALGPQFLLHPGGRAYWMSAYLPVNAALRALAGLVGARRLVSPVLAAISVVACFGVGRRLWPDRPHIAWFAAVMLATSSQFLVTAMTPYAMTAHLAFNLVWLWLFLSNRWWGHAGAIIVGFLACGLHQLAFHPLFVAPFILQLWLDRRWRIASLYTVAYAGICFFWLDYAALAARTVGAIGLGDEVGARWFASHAHIDLVGVGLMAKNLIRFATWQNLLTGPLLVLGARAAVRAKGATRALIGGLVLTVLTAYVIMAYQGHGWGYRYVHGLLGSACLLAAWTGTNFTDGLDAAEQARSRAVFGALAAASLLILFPIRAWQAHHFVHPYAMADAEIRGAKTGAVIVDDAGIWFGLDLVRNDPYLTNRPMVFYRPFLNDASLRDLCARYTISVFDRADAARLGIRTFAVPTPGQTSDLKPLLRDLKCGMNPITAANEPGVGRLAHD